MSDPLQRDPVQPDPVRPDPLQPYPVRPPAPELSTPAAPATGFTVPPALYAADEPLISDDFSGWWSRGVRIVKAGWRPLAAVQVGGGAVIFAVTALIGVVELSSLPATMVNRTPGAPPPSTDEFLGSFLRLLGFSLGGAAVTGFVSLLVTLMTVHIVMQVASGRHARLGPAARASLPRILPLLGWSLLAGLIMLGGLCACVLPLFYFLAVFTVLPVVVMVERRGSAVSRCFRLFHGDLGTSVGRIAVIVGLGFGVGVVAAVIETGLSRATGGVTAGLGVRVAVLLVGGLLSTVLRGALGMFTAPLIVLTYADQRARVEILSSAQLVQEVGLGPEDVPAPVAT